MHAYMYICITVLLYYVLHGAGAGLLQGEHSTKQDETDKQILLPSKDAEDYVADYLYKIIPRILNPKSKRIILLL